MGDFCTFWSHRGCHRKNQGKPQQGAQIARTHELIRLIGVGLLENNEGIENILKLLSNELGNCPSCNVLMACCAVVIMFRITSLQKKKIMRSQHPKSD